MTPTQLRNSILQTAITGALVPQNPDEGSADALISQIEDEKRRLIADRNAAKIAAARAAGKSDAEIKKLKLEKYTAPTPVNPEDAPFEIPQSWRWVRLGDIGITNTGTTPSKTNPKFFGTFIPFVSPGDIQNNKLSYRKEGLSEEGYKVARAVPSGTILQVCIGGCIGKLAITDREITFNQQINSITPYLVESKYLFAVLGSDYFYKQITNNITGSATPIINKSSWESKILPLSPLSEQRRIVSKLEELLPLVEEYGEAQTELEALNAALPDKLKKSLLQQAITGRLVPQTESDGTAEQLLLQIEDEKRRLIAERNAAKIAAARAAGKSDAEIKKLKLEKYSAPKPVNPEDAPFEIPQSWRWVRLGDIISISSGDGLTSKEMQNGDIPVFGGNGITGYHNSYNVSNETIVIGRVGYYCGSVHITPVKAWVTDNAFITTYPQKYIDRNFLVLVLRFLNLGKQHNATAQPVVSGKKIYPLLLPLPPLSEQRRIVAKLEEMFLEIEKLGNQE